MRWEMEGKHRAQQFWLYSLIEEILALLHSKARFISVDGVAICEWIIA
jgi:hypothetical protein